MPEAASQWTITIHRETKRELRRLPKRVLQSALEAIRALADDPYPVGCSRLKGHESLYRIRVGDWRIVYDVDGATHTVTVLRVASRGEVYRDL